MLTVYPKIFLTGATGWLGQRVAQALTIGMPGLGEAGKGGHALHCLVPAGEAIKNLTALGADITVGSLNDGESLKRFLSAAEGSLVMHIAGLIHPPGAFLGHTQDFNRINVDGTRQLMRAATAAGVSRVVVMSSNSPFGGNPNTQHRFTEAAPYNPYMGYGRSKMLMETMLRQQMGQQTIPEIVIVRAPWFYGPGQPPRQTLFFTMIKEGKFPIVGNGLNRRSMGYVDSLALGLLLAGFKDEARNDIFWIADEEPYTMLEIVETVSTVLKDDFGIKTRANTLRLPSIAADIARLCDTALQAAGLYHQKIHVLSEMNMTIACDIGKAQRILGYQPLVQLREGMRRSVAWCLEKGLSI